MKFETKKRWIWALLSFGSVVPFLGMALFFRSLTIDPPMSDADLEATKQICAELSVPQTFVKQNESRQIVKSGLAVFSTTYRSTAEPESVEEYFKKQLTPRGWTYERTSNSGSVILRFRKGKNAVALNYESFHFIEDWQYGISCSYGVD